MEKVKLSDGLRKKYVIPCFQREYAWEEEEIERLIDNILDVNDDYCLGIITVNKDNKLIDGQQRLTTLYMIAMYCEYIKDLDNIKLSYEVDDILDNKRNELIDLFNNKTETVNSNLFNGWNTICRYIKNEDKIKITKAFDNYLYYYEIELNDDIDINHYFEVMNSRGVQLSRSDIIKSYLMNKLSDENKQKLNYLWYKYEIMDTNTNDISSFDKISSKSKSEYKSINDILNNNVKIRDNGKSVRFDDDNSILNFEYFLLYVIRLYNNKNNIMLDYTGEFNLKDLIKEYEYVFKNANNDMIVEFLNFMIKIKNIYDNKIIKFDESNSKWKIGKNSSKIILIQSCLRVSFINRKSMHWLYKTLAYFYEKSDMDKYIEYMENYIKNEYIISYLNDYKAVNYRSGFDTKNIVLNLLDYFIKTNKKLAVKVIPEAKYVMIDSFTFKFRNSIEHYMPRHDENGNENDKWVDDLGNLALLAYNTNTKMQNASPDEKAQHFIKELSNYSIKLQIMTYITKKRGWNEKECKYVTEKMIKLLELSI